MCTVKRSWVSVAGQATFGSLRPLISVSLSLQAAQHRLGLRLRMTTDAELSIPVISLPLYKPVVLSRFGRSARGDENVSPKIISDGMALAWDRNCGPLILALQTDSNQRIRQRKFVPAATTHYERRIGQDSCCVNEMQL